MEEFHSMSSNYVCISISGDTNHLFPGILKQLITSLAPHFPRKFCNHKQISTQNSCWQPLAQHECGLIIELPGGQWPSRFKGHACKISPSPE